MLEVIIMTCFLLVLTPLFWIATDYYVNKRPLKESVENGLYVGTFSAAMLAITATPGTHEADYQLIVIGTALGITMFLLTVVFRYYVHNRPLKDSIEWGLIAGSGYVILFLIVILIIRNHLIFYLI